MKNYLLVHGAWHGDWCWNNLLENLGRENHVFTVIYPKKNSDDITLEDYVLHLLQRIKSIQGKVVLVGHSFAGLVISEAASRCPEKILELIYINGFIPRPHESLWDMTPILKTQNLTPYLVINEENLALSLEPWSIVGLYMYNKTIKDNIPFAFLKAEPLKPLMEKVTLSEAFASIKKRAIISRYDLTLSMSDQIRMCERYQIPYEVIDADHCPFSSAPLQLADLVLS